MDKEDVACIHNGVLTIKENTGTSLAATRMDLEMTILSVIRKRKTSIIRYHVNVESTKSDTNELSDKTETLRHRQQMWDGHTERRKSERKNKYCILTHICGI